MIIREEPEGGYTACVPSLDGCISYGETIEEVRMMIKDAIECYKKCLKEHGDSSCDDSNCYVEEISVNDE